MGRVDLLSKEAARIVNGDHVMVGLKIEGDNKRAVNSTANNVLRKEEGYSFPDGVIHSSTKPELEFPDFYWGYFCNILILAHF